MTVPDTIRQELIRLCSDSTTRRSIFTPEAPTKWHPEQAIDPESGEPYTKVGAWERVHEELTDGCALNLKILDKPRGKKGYELHFYDAVGTRIYVKLQILSGFVMGRSFHEG